MIVIYLSTKKHQFQNQYESLIDGLHLNEKSIRHKKTVMVAWEQWPSTGRRDSWGNSEQSETQAASESRDAAHCLPLGKRAVPELVKKRL